jgi:hypothetical protein
MDWTGSEGFRQTRLTMNVRMQPAITLSTIGFSAQQEAANNDPTAAAAEQCDGTWCCDPDSPAQKCPLGMFDLPVQPHTSVNQGSGNTYPIQLTITESDLHGKRDLPLFGSNYNTNSYVSGSVHACDQNAAAVTDVSAYGSNSTFSKDCGIRFFARFPDPTLSTVAPVGVSVSVLEMQNVISTLCPTGCEAAGTCPTQCVRDQALVGGDNIEKITASKLAQSLQMPCTQYSLAATGAAASDCRERFVAVTGSYWSSADQRKLHYAQDPSVVLPTRVHNGQLAISDHHSGALEWRVGEKMSRKEVILVGSDNVPNQPSDYSFSNHQCERVRQFEVNLHPAAGYSPEILGLGYDKILINVLDDDFYGEYRLGYAGSVATTFSMTDSSGLVSTVTKTADQVIPIMEDTNAAKEVELHKEGERFTSASNPTDRFSLSTWRNLGDGLTFFVERARTAEESPADDLDHGRSMKNRPMHASSVRVQIDAGDLAPSDWKIETEYIHGNPGETLAQGPSVPGTTIMKNDGFLDIDFSGCDPTDPSITLCHTAAASGTWPAGSPQTTTTAVSNLGKCECANDVIGARQAFQWVKLKFVSTGGGDGCSYSFEQKIRFTIAKVIYPDADEVEASYAGTEIVPASCPRNPRPALPYDSTVVTQPAGTVSAFYRLTVTENAQTIYDDNPMRSVWAGLDTSLEATKDAPLHWYGGLQVGSQIASAPLFSHSGSSLSITETEHSECQWSGMPKKMECASREFRMHICLQQRKDDALLVDPVFNWQTAWGQYDERFWVTLNEPVAQPWANIGDLYELTCPTTSELQSRSGGVNDVSCTPYSKKKFEYIHQTCDVSAGVGTATRTDYLGNTKSGDVCNQVVNETGTRTKPVPCNFDGSYKTVCNDACESQGNTPSDRALDCYEAAPGVWRNRKTNQLQVCLEADPNAEYSYCEATGTKPYRLHYRFKTSSQTSEGAGLRCPKSDEVTGINGDITQGMTFTGGNTNLFNSLPYINVKILDDSNVINLSRRPSLCMYNDELPSSYKETTNSCGRFGKGENSANPAASESGACVPLRIADDEVFVTNNAYEDRDLNLFEASFSEPTWNSIDGKVEVSVTDRYFDQNDAGVPDNERTLVNFGIGSCPPDTTTLWNNPSHNLLADTNQNAFGNCDFVDEAALETIFAGKSKAEVFALLFGAASTQPASDHHGSAKSLFGADATNGVGGATSNTLFRSPRSFDASTNKEWKTSRASISNHSNADLSSRGFTGTFSASLEDLQGCLLRNNDPALVTSVDAATGNTMYTFSLSATHVTAKRKGDTSYPVFSTQCVDREYTLTVGNKLMALSGVRTAGGVLDGEKQDSVAYVDLMGYEESDTCIGTSDPAADWTANCKELGPEHSCDAPDCSTNPETNLPNCKSHLKRMEYTVNLDMRVLSRPYDGATVKSYYGVSKIPSDLASSVVVDDERNCYGAAPEEVDIGFSDDGAGANDNSVVRTTIKFATSCLNLKNAAGVVQADTFASCANSTLSPTDFSFDVQLHECTDETQLFGDPKQGSTCQLLPDKFRVTIAMAFVENPSDTVFVAPYEKMMRFYRSVDHRYLDSTTNQLAYPASSTYDSADPKTEPTELKTWRENQIISTNRATPVVTYPSDAMAVFSLGFKEGSALESTMTSAIKDVNLCEFRKPCWMAGYVPFVQGADEIKDIPECKWELHLRSGASDPRSPLALWARNQPISETAGHPGCADEAATGATQCDVQSTLQQDGNGNDVSPPYLTCDTAKWEDWLVKEAQAGLADQNRFGTIELPGTETLDVPTMVQILNPVRSSQSLISNGKTTPYAESLYGNCEVNAESYDVTATEQVTDASGNSYDLHHIFPKAGPEVSGEPTPSGACTCKGQRAYMYQDVNQAAPYQDASARKVIYSNKLYSDNVNDVANLHRCTWRNSPGQSVTDNPVNSVDQFAFSLKKMLRNVEYHFEVTAVQYDTNAFGTGSIDLTTDQFDLGASSRRLLAMADELPAASIKRRAHLRHQAKSIKRNLLSTLTSMHGDAMSTNLIMPQGPVQYQEADPSQAITTQGSGSFMVVGPSVDHAGDHSDFNDASKEDEQIFDITPTDDSVDRAKKRFDKSSGLGEALEAVWKDFPKDPKRLGDTLAFVLDPKDFFEYADMEEKFWAVVGIVPLTALVGALLMFCLGLFNPLQAASPAGFPASKIKAPNGSQSPFDLGATDKKSMKKRKRSNNLFTGGHIAAAGTYDLLWVCMRDDTGDPMPKYYEPTRHTLNYMTEGKCHNVAVSMVILFSELMHILTGYYLAACLSIFVWVPAFFMSICSNKTIKQIAEQGSYFVKVRKSLYYMLDFSCYEKFCEDKRTLFQDADGKKDCMKWLLWWFRFWFIFAIRVAMLTFGPMFIYLSLVVAGIYYIVYWVVQLYTWCTNKNKDTAAEPMKPRAGQESAFAPTKAEQDFEAKQEESPFNV